MKLISLNIEGNLHFDRWIPWVHRESPEVLCLQEIFEDSYAFIKEEFKCYGHFCRTVKIPAELARSRVHGSTDYWGVALLSKYPLGDIRESFYVGGPQDYAYRDHDQCNRAVISALIQPNGQDAGFRVATTHFTWSPEGKNTPVQFKDWESLQEKLREFNDLILVGDMNVPRGTELSQLFLREFSDALPASYVTSLDEKIHRVGHLQRMVDHLLVRGTYHCTQAELVSGLSDHKAIKATFTKNSASVACSF